MVQSSFFNLEQWHSKVLLMLTGYKIAEMNQKMLAKQKIYILQKEKSKQVKNMSF